VKRLFRLAGLSFIVSLMAVGTAAAEDKPPANARPLSAAELLSLYAGKTWVWNTGAGYFAPDRKFLGWSGSGIGTNYAYGRWTASDRGTVCMFAWWHDRWAGFPATACFKHVEANGDIYQQRTSIGASWYIFKHATVQKDDEFNKLVAGDQVSDTYEKVKLFVHRPSLTSVPANLTEFLK
jgi:hypothetical protein